MIQKLKSFILAIVVAFVTSIALAHSDGIYNPTANNIGNFEGIDSNGSSSVPFSPSQLTNLIAWYKADAGTFTDTGCTTPATNGQTIGCWKDQSTAGNNLIQATAGSQPTYNTASLNSLPTISAAAAKSMSASSVSIGGTVISVFMVVQGTGASGGNSGRTLVYNVAGSDTGATAFIAAFFNGSLTAVAAYNNGVKSAGTVVSGSWNEIGSIFDGVNNTLYIGGTGQTPVAATPTFAATGALLILNNPAGGNFLIGSIAEIIVCKAALTSTDRTNIKNYLFAKWGV